MSPCAVTSCRHYGPRFASPCFADNASSRAKTLRNINKVAGDIPVGTAWKLAGGPTACPLGLGLALALEIERRCVTDESFEGGFVEFVALVNVDGAPDISFEAGVKELRGILQLSALGEGDLDNAFVGLSRADHPVVIPDGNAAPFPFLSNSWGGLFDQGADPGEHLAAPVTEFFDPCVD